MLAHNPFILVLFWEVFGACASLVFCVLLRESYTEAAPEKSPSPGAESSGATDNGLTSEDRELLSSLWSQAEPFLSPTLSPPPKPPLLLDDSEHEVDGAGECLAVSLVPNINGELIFSCSL